jgi:uncharacterized protein (DUF302 family)
MQANQSQMLSTTIEGPIEAAIERVTDALQAEGFGILTRIDVTETLKKKLGVDFRRYEILGACNPPLAHRALQAELDVGLMMPCNVIAYETDDGRVHVGAFDPMAFAEGNPQVTAVAAEARQRLDRVISALGRPDETDE